MLRSRSAAADGGAATDVAAREFDRTLAGRGPCIVDDRSHQRPDLDRGRWRSSGVGVEPGHRQQLLHQASCPTYALTQPLECTRTVFVALRTLRQLHLQVERGERRP